MSGDPEEPRDFDAFLSELASALNLDSRGWTMSSRLVDDVDLDSLDFYELFCTVEDLGRCEFADELLVTWETLGDVYRCYENNFQVAPKR